MYEEILPIPNSILYKQSRAFFHVVGEKADCVLLLLSASTVAHCDWIRARPLTVRENNPVASSRRGRTIAFEVHP